MRTHAVLGLFLLAVVLPACSGTTAPAPTRDFIVSVEGERFVLRLTDPQSIQLAEDNRQGRNEKIPIGPLRPGNGGFNAPWTWHLDPAQARMVDATIELCGATPSYVEQHQDKFPTYCPWAARVIDRR